MKQIPAGKYLVSTVATDAKECLTFNELGTFDDKVKAMNAAKKAAGRGSRFDGQYGPTACAYIGKAQTVVVAW